MGAGWLRLRFPAKRPSASVWLLSAQPAAKPSRLAGNPNVNTASRGESAKFRRMGYRRGAQCDELGLRPLFLWISVGV
jgi:hypothetical protein